jgi:hypothetical protein
LPGRFPWPSSRPTSCGLGKTRPAGKTPLLPSTAFLDNAQKAADQTPAKEAAKGTTGVTTKNGQLGNLLLTITQQACPVNFFKASSNYDSCPGEMAQKRRLQETSSSSWVSTTTTGSTFGSSTPVARAL